MTNKPVSCIILAGGKGKRFNNKDKGLIELNGKPLVQHVIDNVKHQVDDIVISANRNINTYKELASRVVTDNLSNFQGPLTGIASALPHCKHPWVLVVPCDIPLLPDKLVETLTHEPNNRLNVLKVNGRLQLIFLLHRDLLESLNKYLDDSHHKVMDWVSMQNPSIVELDINTTSFTNLNTSEQLDELSN